MNKIKHRQAREALNDLIGEWRYDGTLGQYINQQEKQDELLKLYKEFYETLNPTIEHDTTDEDDLPIDFEYLDISGATDRTLEIVKQIKELEQEIEDEKRRGKL